MPQYISPAECTKWLHDRNIVEALYGSKNVKSKYCCQYKITGREEFASNVIKELGDFKEGLLIFMDWHFYHPDDWQYYKPHQLPLIEMVHPIALKQPSNYDVGLGFLYTSDKYEELVSHIKISIEQGWSVYLYPDSASATLYFWEGALMDVWSDSKTTFSNLEKFAG